MKVIVKLLVVMVIFNIVLLLMENSAHCLKLLLKKKYLDHLQKMNDEKIGHKTIGLSVFMTNFQINKTSQLLI